MQFPLPLPQFPRPLARYSAYYTYKALFILATIARNSAIDSVNELEDVKGRAAAAAARADALVAAEMAQLRERCIT